MKSATRAAIGLLIFAIWQGAALIRASAQEGAPPTPSDITHQAGVNTALSAANSAATPDKLQTPSGAVTCPPGIPAPVNASIPACNASNITRPNSIGNGSSPAPACGSAPDSKYQQLVFLNTQVYKLMAQHAADVAAHLSCMLGVKLTAAHITDALADMSAQICQGGPNANREFIIACGREEGAAAYFQGGSPYGGSTKGFAGALTFNIDKLDVLSASEESHGSDVNSLRQRRFKRQDFMDTLIHENTHALTSYLSHKFAAHGANYQGKYSQCSVGPLTRQYTPKCGPNWDFSALGGAQPYKLGSNSYDEQTYSPYPTVSADNEQIKSWGKWIKSHQTATAPLLKRRDKSQPLTDTQKIQLEAWDDAQARLTEYQAYLPCSQAYADAGANAIMQDWDDSAKRPAGCTRAPSTRFRDEADARSVARLLAGSNCQEADGYFFNSIGGVRTR